MYGQQFCHNHKLIPGDKNEEIVGTQFGSKEIDKYAETLRSKHVLWGKSYDFNRE